MISAPIPESDTQKQTEADKIQAAWSWLSYQAGYHELKTAAQLAKEGYLSTVKNLWIWNGNISEIPSDNIGKLASIVTDRVYIENVTPVSQVGAILASVQSKELVLKDISFSEENTRALVTAMSKVQTVTLGYFVKNLDPELLSAYDGQGNCTKLAVEVWSDTRDKYGSRLRSWAADKGWTVTVDDDVWLVMNRLGQGIHIIIIIIIICFPNLQISKS